MASIYTTLTFFRVFIVHNFTFLYLNNTNEIMMYFKFSLLAFMKDFLRLLLTTTNKIFDEIFYTISEIQFKCISFF